MTTFLYDTHVILWAALAPDRLGRTAKAIVEDGAGVVSTISAHEISRLVAMNQLIDLQAPLSAWLGRLRVDVCFEWVEVSADDAIESYQLPGFVHRDPCDRLIVAAARTRGLTILTADEKILGYAKVRTQDARG